MLALYKRVKSLDVENSQLTLKIRPLAKFAFMRIVNRSTFASQNDFSQSMKQALIVFQSKYGITKKFAEKIGCYFNSMNVEANVIPIEKFRKDLLTGADYVFLGCWTNSAFLLNQKPEKEWIDFVSNIQIDKNQKIGLFTTYNILTGSMFRNMKKYLLTNETKEIIELKSRNGLLSDFDKQRLLKFLN